MPDSMILTLNVLLYLTSFILGFVVGRITNPLKSLELNASIDAKRSFLNQPKKKVVSIDDRKFVTDISTDKFEKKGGELGKQTTISDDVGSAASRLAMLKKNK